MIGRYVAVACGLAGALLSAQQLPSEPRRGFGASITGAFEGWYANPDGSRTFLVGYLNRNADQALDVPIGPDNRIEPGGPDLGQPTHFLPGRRHGMFSIVVPREFTSPEQRLTWTIVANGQTTVIPIRLHPDYLVSPFSDVAVRNTPPVLRFDGGWGTDSRPRGAPVRRAHAPVETLAGGGVNVPFSGRATTTARFSEPGEYVLHVTAMDYSGEGGGGEVCCWTTAMVKVSVMP